MIPEHLQAETADSLEYLRSDEAAESIERDVYWPKWHSPWWHMLLLHELHLTPLIPLEVLTHLGLRAKAQYLSIFPVREEELPPGIDPVRGIMCHCALGSLYQILFARGLDPEYFLPWAREWFLKYQLPDGGWNCDEAVYVKATPRSSIVSTLPILEAMLHSLKGGPTQAEWESLDRGADYLIRHRLYRRASEPAAIIDQSWLSIRFPRYYEYDWLRGMTFLVDWAEARKRALPRELLGEVAAPLNTALDAETGVPIVGICDLLQNKNYGPDATGIWVWRKTPTSFSLLDAVSRVGTPIPSIRESASRVRQACEVA